MIVRPAFPSFEGVHHVSEHPSTMCPVCTPSREGRPVVCKVVMETPCDSISRGRRTIADWVAEKQTTSLRPARDLRHEALELLPRVRLDLVAGAVLKDSSASIHERLVMVREDYGEA